MTNSKVRFNRQAIEFQNKK